MPDDSTSNGLLLDLRPQAAGYSAGSLPKLVATIVNVSDRDVIFCSYLLEHRLLSTLRGGDFKCLPFGDTPRPPLASTDFQTLAPGQKTEVVVSCGSNSKYGFFPAASQPPSIHSNDAMQGFPAGTYTFEANVGAYVSFYNSPEGVYNRNRERKQIVREVPRASGVTIDPASVWEGDMNGATQISFS